MEGGHLCRAYQDGTRDVVKVYGFFQDSHHTTDDPLQARDHTQLGVKEKEDGGRERGKGE